MSVFQKIIWNHCGKPMNTSPNILFLMSDEHRADVAGFAGNQVVRTPFLDWLSRTGVTFDNAYTPSPICVPARQCMASGQLPRSCGVEYYGQDLAPESMTFARRFSEYGYDTVACGKLHHMGPDQMQGWTRRVGMDHMLSQGAIQNFQADRATPLDSNKRAADHWKDGAKWNDAKEIKRAGIGKGPHTHVWDQYATEGCQHIITEHFLDPYYDKCSPEKPMLLYLGLSNPHYPYLAEETLFNYYLNRVPVYTDEPAFDHPWLGRSAFMPKAVSVGANGDVSEREARRATAAYYANIETIDQQYQSVVDNLRAAGQNIDDWIIVYCSDHGEMLGEHSIWEKQKFFEASVRVPLIIRWPKGFNGGRHIKQNVSLCDLFATLCDLAQIDCPDGLDSRSLAPLLHGTTYDAPNEAISQFVGKHCMVKLDTLKYQCYGSDGEEVLFDLAADPNERRNLIGEPRYNDALVKLRSRATELGF